MNSIEIERVKKFVMQCKEGYDMDDIIDIGDIIMRHKCFPKYIKQYVKEYEDENKVYTYMLTFTIDPKRHDVESTSLHDMIEDYVITFAERRNPLKADLVKEGTDEDHKHIHWHLGLELKKYIDFSNFLKFYRNKYGSVDISKSWSNDYNNIITYINKSVPSQQIV